MKHDEGLARVTFDSALHGHAWGWTKIILLALMANLVGSSRAHAPTLKKSRVKS